MAFSFQEADSIDRKDLPIFLSLAFQNRFTHRYMHSSLG